LIAAAPLLGRVEPQRKIEAQRDHRAPAELTTHLSSPHLPELPFERAVIEDVSPRDLHPVKRGDLDGRIVRPAQSDCGNWRNATTPTAGSPHEKRRRDGAG